METQANYVLIGTFTFIVAIAAVLFGLYSAQYATESAWQRYQILFRQSVIGLSDGSPVLFNGVKVGRVAELELNPDDVREVLATIEIKSGVPVHQDTVATIRLTGLTGTAAIQLRGGDPESPLLENGDDKPPRIEAVESPLNRLMESSEGIVVTANKVLTRIDSILSEENERRITNTLDSLERFSNDLADPESNVGRLLANAGQASENLPQMVSSLNDAAVGVDKIVTAIDQDFVAGLPEMQASLSATLTNMESLTGRIDTIIASNQEDLTRIGGIGMRQITGGLEELRRLIRDLSGLVQRIETNPRRFLLGQDQPEEYQPQ
ncbi:MAG: MlaD family protein [Wenzhouxiangellaceae bacterium]|nr:MlaD family protein [Wenzhouxiangellaceae bacterium]